MGPENERLIKESWTLLAPRAGQLSASFRRRLGANEPTASRLLSRGDGAGGLPGLLEAVVAGVEAPERLVVQVASVADGAVHGLVRRELETLGFAALSAIEDTLGNDATPEVCGAWRELFTVASEVLLRAMERHSASRAATYD